MKMLSREKLNELGTLLIELKVLNLTIDEYEASKSCDFDKLKEIVKVEDGIMRVLEYIDKQ